MREKELIKRMMPTKDIAGAEMILPNTSGDHVKGIKRAVPAVDADLVNKKYVDDQITALPSHTQGTDQALDTGGANQVTAAQAKTAYTHSQVAGGDSVHVSVTENTNWDTAYTHSQDNTQAHSDYMLNTGDTATGNYTFDTNVLFVDATNDRVGIGTVSPTTPLYIYKNDDTTTATGLLRLENPSANAVNNGMSIGFYQSTNARATIKSYYSAATNWILTLGYGTAETLTINNAGYVGIGDTTPSCALDVTGQIKTQALTITTGGGAYAAGSLGYTDANWGFLHRPPQAGANAAHHFEKSDGTDLMSIGEDGDVGIGIVNPNSKFEVVTGATDGRQAISIDQNDEDQAFIDYEGTSAADATKNISTAAISAFTYAGMIKVEINGTARWIPFYQVV